MANGERFTAWLSVRERETLRRVSDSENVSENMILRTSLRAVLFDEPLPNWLLAALATDATETTGSKERVPA